ncbi:DHA2 family efflux MFS transporter permease subunit [Streptomyces sp. NPDC088196]|uniref:DHA2 family efflux MFS transporter permease subunit n=1 Tax=Streptomyces sp. NPDC088196 TaxID=3154868 RepID=UPI003450E857
MTASPSKEPDRATEQPGLTPEARRAVIVVLVGAVLAFLDATIVNVALDSLSSALHSSLQTIQWVVTAYLLAQAAVLPMTGWAARKVGPRRLYVASLLLFTLASVACGLVDSAWALIAARTVQGIGGGMMIPAGQIILVTAAGQQGLARVMGAVGIPMVLTPVFGPTVGGLLVDHAGWQWIFLINLPLGLAGLTLALRLLPADRRGDDPGPLDMTGLLLVSLGMVGITFGLSEAGSDHGLGSIQVLGSFLAGLALTAGFVLRALRVRHPLLDVRLYRDRLFGSASFVTFVFGAATYGGMILMPLYYQVVRHEDASTTGLLLAPQGIGAAVAMGLSSRLFEKIGSLTCVIGAAVSVVASVPFVLIGADTSYWLLGLAMVVRGLGIGLSVMPAMTAAFQSLDPGQISDATPQLNMAQRVGGSMGTAVFVVVLQRQLAGGTGPSDQAAAFGTTFWWVLGTAVLAVLPTLLMAAVERGRQRGAVSAKESGQPAAVDGVGTA